MNKTKIEWVKNPDGTQGYTWNPITGCLNGCEYCYARKLANGRLRWLYQHNHNVAPACPPYSFPVGYHGMQSMSDPFYPRFWEDRLTEPIRGYHKADWWGVTPDAASGKGIFVCDMSDLFGIGIPQEWTKRVMDTIKKCPQDRFYLLTKQPQNLIKFSPFPGNCEVGGTATDYKQYEEALNALCLIEARVGYISFEPLLENIKVNTFELEKRIQWVIIGACTGRKNEIFELCKRYPDLTPMPYGRIWTAQPQIAWVEEIVRACDKAGILVFLKDNLKPLLSNKPEFWEYHHLLFHSPSGKWLRQEMPK